MAATMALIRVSMQGFPLEPRLPLLLFLLLLRLLLPTVLVHFLRILLHGVPTPLVHLRQTCLQVRQVFDAGIQHIQLVHLFAIFVSSALARGYHVLEGGESIVHL